MPNKKQAFDNIRAACQALEEARRALSAALLDHANDEGKRGGEYAELHDGAERPEGIAGLQAFRQGFGSAPFSCWRARCKAV